MTSPGPSNPSGPGRFHDALRIGWTNPRDVFDLLWVTDTRTYPPPGAYYYGGLESMWILPGRTMTSDKRVETERAACPECETPVKYDDDGDIVCQDCGWLADGGPELVRTPVAADRPFAETDETDRL